MPRWYSQQNLFEPAAVDLPDPVSDAPSRPWLLYASDVASSNATAPTVFLPRRRIA
jgi:hypothetical protein